MTIAKKLIITSLLISLAAPAFAQTPSDARSTEINNRAANEQQRIDQGVQSGQLTTKEASHLEKKQARTDKHIAKAEANGKVSKHEARKINKEENKESNAIHEQKHDGQTQ
jgi:septal ring factor EnvC (AmiA/AmiB activator)